MTFEELSSQELLVLSDVLCEHCKEAKDRDTKYLIELPSPTRNMALKVRVCPHCDGESLVEKAYVPRDEQKEPDIS